MSLPNLVGDIIALSAKGHGVAKGQDGRTYFIAGTWPGDRVAYRPTSVQGRYAQAILEEILIPSPDRVPAACPHLGLKPGQCSGCPWMIAQYQSQLSHKESRLKHAFEKRGLPADPEVLLPAWGSPKTLGHRNRAQLKTDGSRLGFVSEGTNVIAPIQDCLALNDQARRVLHEAIETLPRRDWLPGRGHIWNFIDIDEDIGPGQEFILNRRRPFKQSNNEQNMRMRQWLREQLSNVSIQSSVLELFCGSGNFTEVISQCGFAKILAVEVAGQAIETLKSKNLPNTLTLALDLYSRAQWSVIEPMLPDARVLILDPPRQGLMKKKSFFQHFQGLEMVIYISCDMQSFSVDALEFLKRGWRITQVQPVDQFPHTPHLEILSVFVK